MIVSRNFLLFLLLLLVACPTFGQIVEVVSENTGEPVKDVLVIVKDQAFYGSEDGKVYLDEFSDQEKLTFQHPSFLPKSTTKEKIVSNNNRITLVENPIYLDEIIVPVPRRNGMEPKILNETNSTDTGQPQSNNP